MVAIGPRIFPGVRRAANATTYPGVRTADGSLRAVDVDSVDALVARLESLGVIALTAHRQTALWQPLPTLPAPRFFLDVATPAAVREGAELFVQGQEALRRDYAATSTTHRLLSPAECHPVAWGIDTLEAIADMSGVVCRNTLALEHFLMVPANDPHLGSKDGRPNMGSCHTTSGLLFIHAALSSTDSVVTAIHEAAHGLSAQRVYFRTGNAPIVYGVGLSLGKLFRGLYEGYTASLTTRALDYGRRNEVLHDAAIAAHGSSVVPWQDYHDDCYSKQQQRLAEVLAETYSCYTDQHVSTEQFVTRTDRPAKTLRRLFDRAYFAGELTIFGLLYHALGDTGFRELAAMDVD